MAEKRDIVPADRIERTILLIRGEKVMLDADLAVLYGVPTKVLNQAVRRNLDRFPADFMFQLTWEEARDLRSQFVTLNGPDAGEPRSHFVTLKRGGNIKYRPYAFTEHGVAMLSSVLRSQRAVAVNIEIMRAFVRLRGLLATHAELSRKMDALEKKYDRQFRVVFDAIRRLMAPPAKTRKRVGFLAERNGRGGDTMSTVYRKIVKRVRDGTRTRDPLGHSQRVHSYKTRQDRKLQRAKPPLAPGLAPATRKT